MAGMNNQQQLARSSALASWLISLPPRGKMLIAMCSDFVVLGIGAVLAIVLTNSAREVRADMLVFVAPLIVITALLLAGAYRAVIRFIGMEFVYRTASATLVATLMLFALHQNLPARFDAPWNVLLLFCLNGFFLLVLTRMIARHLLRPEKPHKGATKVLIYGAGNAGTQVASALAMNMQCRPVGFIEDRRDLQGRTILGYKVYSPSQLPALKARGEFETVLLAMPTLTRARRRELLESLESLAVKVLVMPALEDLASGRKQVDDLREVQIEDLLDREPVAPIETLLHRFIKNKAVAVTGAGGSIGSELCRQVMEQGASKLVLIENCEYSLYRIDRELRAVPELQGCEIVPVLGTVLDETMMIRALREHAIETVYHAAAYKHVPLVESNVATAVRNNVFGTLHTARAALASGVRNFVLISTDKAVRPTNVMGASKRVCELIIQALAEKHPDRRMSMVRFGNVLASSGSVVPLFREQIQQGGPVTVTHPEITRYFMTIPEAAQLVLQAGSMGQQGEVFVLDMGQPVKIFELAQKMIHLSGLQVRDGEHGQGDIEIRFTGLRAGEKLYEELLIGDNPEHTEHARILKAREAHLAHSELESVLPRLAAAIAQDDTATIIHILKGLVPGYAPQRPAELPKVVQIPATRGKEPMIKAAAKDLPASGAALPGAEASAPALQGAH
jgi:FlaA1/EpsC-like NDP-sugar epimerase